MSFVVSSRDPHKLLPALGETRHCSFAGRKDSAVPGKLLPAYDCRRRRADRWFWETPLNNTRLIVRQVVVPPAGKLPFVPACRKRATAICSPPTSHAQHQPRSPYHDPSTGSSPPDRRAPSATAVAAPLNSLRSARWRHAQRPSPRWRSSPKYLLVAAGRHRRRWPSGLLFPLGVPE